jgi:glycosyltransferase involved in cell wall biosynthesis
LATLTLSIIVPAHNNADELRDCLVAAAAQCGPDTELLVVDDASVDDTSAVAAALAHRVLRLPENAGPAAARNHGAGHARGEVLLFVDADVVIGPGTVDRVRRCFGERPDVAAVFGSYDAMPRARGVVSRYRNLLHHYVHQKGDPVASTFWAGCGAIRRSVFQQVGGFDAQRFRRPSIEDIELGHRLRRAGHVIVLDNHIQGTHLKRWTLRSMIRTDIVQRALPWARLIQETEVIPDTLNLAKAQRWSAALVVAAGGCLLLAGARGELAVLAPILLIGVVVLNRELYLFFARHGGAWFTLASIGLHLLYFAYSTLTYVFAWLEHRIGAGSRRMRPSAMSGS